MSSDKGGGIRVAGVREDGAKGLIEFQDCTIKNVEKFGLEITHKSADGIHVRFANCTWRNVARRRVTEIPLQIALKPNVQRNGGIEFAQCLLEDDKARPFITTHTEEQTTGVYDIKGEITVRNPHGALAVLGNKTHNVDLRVIEKR